MLQIYNTLTRQKQEFVPLEPGKVRMYVCGMTVYDHCHLGHARMMVVFDVVVRHLRAEGFDVTYVRNITDVDDKIIQRAAENGEPPEVLAARYIDALHEDTDALGLLRPDAEPRATEAIDWIIDMTERLVRSGHAYVADNGDVYYRVSRFADYGRLSGKQVADLRAGARVEIGEAKEDPVDFVLWKAAKPGEPQWDSPWGPGRPGWHIECSAMATHCLGPHFDIHGGGADLIFPHHENEIAQSEAANDHHPFVNVWMHSGFLQIRDEKMSKSLGNFFTLRDVLREYAPEEVRYFLLSSHYRSPLNYSEDHLHGARSALTRAYTALRGVEVRDADPDPDFVARFRAAMNDDFNTPGALAVLFDLARDLNRHRGSEPARAAQLAHTLHLLGGRLGLLQADPESYLQHADAAVGELSAAEVEALVAQRKAARQRKDFGEADRIRDLLSEQGVVLEDSPQGTLWRRA